MYKWLKRNILGRRIDSPLDTSDESDESVSCVDTEVEQARDALWDECGSDNSQQQQKNRSSSSIGEFGDGGGLWNNKSNDERDLGSDSLQRNKQNTSEEKLGVGEDKGNGKAGENRESRSGKEPPADSSEDNRNSGSADGGTNSIHLNCSPSEPSEEKGAMCTLLAITTNSTSSSSTHTTPCCFSHNAPGLSCLYSEDIRKGSNEGQTVGDDHCCGLTAKHQWWSRFSRHSSESPQRFYSLGLSIWEAADHGATNPFQSQVPSAILSDFGPLSGPSHDDDDDDGALAPTTTRTQQSSVVLDDLLLDPRSTTSEENLRERRCDVSLIPEDDDNNGSGIKEVSNTNRAFCTSDEGDGKNSQDILSSATCILDTSIKNGCQNKLLPSQENDLLEHVVLSEYLSKHTDKEPCHSSAVDSGYINSCEPEVDSNGMHDTTLISPDGGSQITGYQKNELQPGDVQEQYGERRDCHPFQPSTYLITKVAENNTEVNALHRSVHLGACHTCTIKPETSCYNPSLCNVGKGAGEKAGAFPALVPSNEQTALDEQCVAEYTVRTQAVGDRIKTNQKRENEFDQLPWQKTLKKIVAEENIPTLQQIKEDLPAQVYKEKDELQEEIEEVISQDQVEQQDISAKVYESGKLSQVQIQGSTPQKQFTKAMNLASHQQEEEEKLEEGKQGDSCITKEHVQNNQREELANTITAAALNTHQKLEWEEEPGGKVKEDSGGPGSREMENKSPGSENDKTDIDSAVRGTEEEEENPSSENDILNQSPGSGSAVTCGSDEGRAFESVQPTTTTAVPCCFPPVFLPPACLYFQQGKLCSVLGERFIVTEVDGAPLLVSTKLEMTTAGPFGVAFVWVDGKPVSLNRFPEGTGVYFDAILFPTSARFVAMVVWQRLKPIYTVEPYFNSYVVVDEFRDLKVQFVSFNKSHGVVKAEIYGIAQSFTVHKSAVFINGQKLLNEKEIGRFSNRGFGQLFGNVRILVTASSSGDTTHHFECTCLWSGIKPQEASIVSDGVFFLYKKTPVSFSRAKEQFTMHCDAQTELVNDKDGCRLRYTYNYGRIIFSSLLESLFHGNRRAAVATGSGGGQVKAHVRWRVNKKKTEIWSVVMIQLPDSLVATHAPLANCCFHKMVLSSVKVHPSVISSTSTTLTSSTASPSKSHVSDDPVEEANTERHSSTHTDTAAQPVEKVAEEEGKKLDFSMYYMASQKAGSSSPLKDVDYEGNEMDDTVMSANQADVNSPTTFDSPQVATTTTTAQQKARERERVEKNPQLLRNWSGKLFWESSNKLFKIETTINNLCLQINLGKTGLYINNGKICQAEMCDARIPVHFDAYSLNGWLKCVFTAIWKGDKPHMTYNFISTCRYYYDIPGVYQGPGSNDTLVFEVTLDGERKTIWAECSNTCIFSEEGEFCASISLLSRVSLHLREDFAILGHPWIAHLVIIKVPDYEVAKVNQDGLGVEDKASKVETSQLDVSDDNIMITSSSNARHFLCGSVKNLKCFYYKNCHGTLYWNDDLELFRISATLGGIPLDLNVGKNAVYIEKGNVLYFPTNIEPEPIQFDVHCVRNTWLKVVAIWKGSKPRITNSSATTPTYYYDVPGVYRGMKNDLLEFDLTLDNGENKTVRTTQSSGVFYDKGRPCLFIPLGSAVCLHLRETCRVDGGTDWEALLVVVGNTSTDLPTTITTNQAAAAVDGVDRACQKSESRLYRNCFGLLSWQSDLVGYRIMTLSGRAPPSICLGKRTWMFENNVAVKLEQDVVNLPVKFDIYIRDGSGKTHQPCALWIGEKPKEAQKNHVIYYYDVPGIFRGFKGKLMKFDLCMRGENFSIKTFSSNHIYTSKGQLMESIPEHSHVLVHLRYNTSLDGDAPWEVLVIVVLPTVSEDEDAMETEGATPQKIYQVLEGRIEMAGSKYMFTYRYQGTENTLPLPLDIAMDNPPSLPHSTPSSSSVVRDFYLISFCHQKNNFPVCGWFGRRSRPLYAEHYQRLVDFDPRDRLLTLCSASGDLTYFELVNRYLVKGKSRHLVEESLVNSPLVHIVIEEITPRIIGGRVVNKRVIFLTGNLALSQAALFFLCLSHVDNENEPLDSHSVTDDGIVEADERVHKNDVLATAGKSDINEIKIMTAPLAAAEKKTTAKKQNERGSVRMTELSESVYFKRRTLSYTDVEDGGGLGMTRQEGTCGLSSRKFIVDPSQPKDRKWLCRATMRSLLTGGKLLKNLTAKHINWYAVLVGRLDVLEGELLFHCDLFPQPLVLPTGIPQFAWRKPDQEKEEESTYYLLAQRHFSERKVAYHPYFLWPEGGKCEPYIITTRQSFLVDTHNQVLGIKDETSGSTAKYTYTYDVAFSLAKIKSVSNFLDTVTTSFYAVVEDIFPVYINGHLIQGQIFLLTASYNIALACISTLLGNVTEFSSHGERKIPTRKERMASVKQEKPDIPTQQEVETPSLIQVNPKESITASSNVSSFPTVGITSVKDAIDYLTETNILTRMISLGTDNELSVDTDIIASIDSWDPEIVKDFLRSCFQDWVPEAIKAQLDCMEPETVLAMMKESIELKSMIGSPGSCGINGIQVQVPEEESPASCYTVVPVNDGEGKEVQKYLRRQTLRQYLAGRSLEELTSKHSAFFPVLLGQLESLLDGSWFFHCAQLPHPLSIPPDVSHNGWRQSRRSGKTCLLTMREHNMDGQHNYQPFFLWPEGGKCDPYIVKVQCSPVIDTTFQVLALQDEESGRLKYCMYNYDVACTQKTKKCLKEFFESVEETRTPVYAVIEDTLPLNIHIYRIEAEILFLTSSYVVALGCISTLVGNYTDLSQLETNISTPQKEEEKKGDKHIPTQPQKEEDDKDSSIVYREEGRVTFKQVCEINQREESWTHNKESILMQQEEQVTQADEVDMHGHVQEEAVIPSHMRSMITTYATSQREADKCTRGQTYFVVASQFTPELVREHFVSFGLLKPYSDEFAVIECFSGERKALCCWSQIFFKKGKPGLESILQSSQRVLLSVILLPFIEPVALSDRIVIDALGVFAWRGVSVKLVMVHECNVHGVVLLPVTSRQIETREKQKGNYHKRLKPGKTSNVLCQAGSTLSGFHEQVLLASGLKRMSVVIKCFIDDWVICAGKEDELVKCKISDIYISGKPCTCMEDLLMTKDVLQLVAIARSQALELCGITISLKAVIGFADFEDLLPCIHICNEHSGGILLHDTDHVFELAIIRDTFSYIQTVWEQSDVRHDYLQRTLRGMLKPRSFTPEVMKTRDHTECSGVVTSGSDESGQVEILLRSWDPVQKISAHRSSLFGLPANMSLKTVAGEGITVYLGSFVPKGGARTWRVIFGWMHSELVFPRMSRVDDSGAAVYHKQQQCCTNSLLIQHFEHVHNRTKFSVVKVARYYEGDEEDVFVDTEGKLISCWKENVIDFREKRDVYWSVLVDNASPSEELAIKEGGTGGWKRGEKDNIVLENRCHKDYVFKNIQMNDSLTTGVVRRGIGAWRGTRQNLKVQVCKIHGVSSVNGTSASRSKGSGSADTSLHSETPPPPPPEDQQCGASDPLFQPAVAQEWSCINSSQIDYVGENHLVVRDSNKTVLIRRSVLYRGTSKVGDAPLSGMLTVGYQDEIRVRGFIVPVSSISTITCTSSNGTTSNDDLRVTHEAAVAWLISGASRGKQNGGGNENDKACTVDGKVTIERSEKRMDGSYEDSSTVHLQIDADDDDDESEEDTNEVHLGYSTSVAGTYVLASSLSQNSGRSRENEMSGDAAVNNESKYATFAKTDSRKLEILLSESSIDLSAGVTGNRKERLTALKPESEGTDRFDGVGVSSRENRASGNISVNREPSLAVKTKLSPGMNKEQFVRENKIEQSGHEEQVCVPNILNCFIENRKEYSKSISGVSVALTIQILRNNSRQSRSSKKEILCVMTEPGPKSILPCFLKTWDNTYGILRNEVGYTMFKRQHIYGKTSQWTMRELSVKYLDALILMLEEPKTVLGYSVNSIGLLVGVSHNKITLSDPVGFLTSMLNVYTEDWMLECSVIPVHQSKNFKLIKLCDTWSFMDIKHLALKTWTVMEMNIRLPPMMDSVICSCVLLRKDFLVLRANGMMVLALRKDFHRGDEIPQPVYWHGCQLKQLKTVFVFPVMLTQPVTIEKFEISHFAVLMYIGKKPAAANNFLAKWKEGNVEKNTTLHVETNEGLEIIHLKFRTQSSVPSSTAVKVKELGSCKWMMGKSSQAVTVGNTASSLLGIRSIMTSAGSANATTTACRSTSSVSQPRATTRKPIKEKIEITVKMPHKIETYVCRCVVVRRELAVLMAKEMVILALQKDFYRDNEKILPSCSLEKQLEYLTGPGVSVMPVVITKPVTVEKHKVTHFALMTYIGKKPLATNEIITRWRKNIVERSTLVNVESTDSSPPKAITFIFGVKGHVVSSSKPTDMAVSQQQPEVHTAQQHIQSKVVCSPPVSTGKAAGISQQPTTGLYVNIIPPVSTGKAAGISQQPTTGLYVNIMTHSWCKVLNTNCARALLLRASCGFLEVTHEKLAGGKAVIYFVRDTLYINKKRPDNNLSVNVILSQYKGRYLGCLARTFASKGNSTERTIMGVETQFMAKKVWYGDRPSKKELETKEDAVAAANVATTQPVTRTSSLVNKAKQDNRPCRSPFTPSLIGKNQGGVKVGQVEEVHSRTGRLRLEDGQLLFFSREKCFLYGFCLDKVELYHVLSIGDKVEYEVTETSIGWEVKGVWAGDAAPHDQDLLPSTLESWCCSHNVPKATKAMLLKEASWLSSDLNPLADTSQDKEVIDLC